MSRKRQQKIVSIDTQTLICHIRKDGPAELKEYAGNLFRQLESERDEEGRNTVQIIVPTVVLSEFLTPIPSQEDRNRVAAEIGRRFLIEPFDARAAVLAAELWNYGKSTREMQHRRHGQRISLRADTMIVATARAHGATEFYSEDRGAREMAEKAGMAGKALPRVAPSLFSDSEDDEGQDNRAEPNE